jgi:hypothetical protein
MKYVYQKTVCIIIVSVLAISFVSCRIIPRSYLNDIKKAIKPDYYKHTCISIIKLTSGAKTSRDYLTTECYKPNDNSLFLSLIEVIDVVSKTEKLVSKSVLDNNRYLIIYTVDTEEKLYHIPLYIYDSNTIAIPVDYKNDNRNYDDTSMIFYEISTDFDFAAIDSKQ